MGLSPDLYPKNTKSFFNILADGVGFASSKDEVLRSILLKHHPHTLDVVTSYLKSQNQSLFGAYDDQRPTVSPITSGIEVTEVEAMLFAKGNICCSPGDLTSDEGPSSSGAFVVEQDAVARIHAICFPVIDGDPESVELSDTIGGTGIERGSLRLWSLNDLSV